MCFQDPLFLTIKFRIFLTQMDTLFHCIKFRVWSIVTTKNIISLPIQSYKITMDVCFTNPIIFLEQNKRLNACFVKDYSTEMHTLLRMHILSFQYGFVHLTGLIGAYGMTQITSVFIYWRPYEFLTLHRSLYDHSQLEHCQCITVKHMAN